MSGDLRVINRQRVRTVNGRELQRMARSLLEDFLELTDYDLTIRLVAAKTMAELNQAYLQHEGSTDVITLDYGTGLPQTELAGEIIICVDEAELQARRFGVSWQEELVRYVVHGVLHLRGYDDRRAAARKQMKREEARLVKKLSEVFRLRKPARKPRMKA